MGKLAICAALVVPTPALAQQVRPIADARLRNEHVDQGGLAVEADALTFRLRAGAELSMGDWSLLAEAESVAALSERYSILNGPGARIDVGHCGESF